MVVPRMVKLSEAEKKILDRYADSLSKRADGFSSVFFDMISKMDVFPFLVRNNLLERVRAVIVDGYHQILAVNEEWMEKLRTASFSHQKLGLSHEDLLLTYDLFYEDMQKGIDALDIPNGDRLILNCAILKRIQYDMFVHVNSFQELQKKELLMRESFYRGLTDTSRMYARFESKPLESALKSLCEILIRDIDAKLSWIGKVSPEDEWVRILAASGEAVDYIDDLRISMDPELPEGMGPGGVTLRTCKPFVLNDFNAPNFKPWTEKAKKYGLGATANTSLVTKDGERWIISIYNEIGRRFPSVIEDLLNDMATNLKLFIESRLKAREVERLRDYQGAMEEIQRKLLEIPSPESVYSLVVKMLTEHTDAYDINISVSEDGSEWLKTVASSGKAANVLINSKVISKNPEKIPEGQTLAARVFRQGKKMLLKEPQKDPYFQILWKKYPELRVRSIGCWPIFDGERDLPVATLAIGSQSPNYFHTDLQRLIGQMVANVEIALNQYRQVKNIKWMGLHDPLTGLPNRVYFDQSASEALVRAKRDKKNLAIGIMDLDKFKEWNDTLGHMAGDELLKDIAGSLQSVVRAGDGIARMGGDEFVFQITFENPDDLRRISERLLKAVSDNRKGELHLTASLGWAVCPRDGEDLKTLLMRADQVMYSSKRKNRNSYEIFGMKKTN